MGIRCFPISWSWLSLYRTCLYWGWHNDFKRKVRSCLKQTIAAWWLWSLSSERMLWDKYRQTYDGAASEVDDVVDRDHLQVQDQLLGPLDWPGQDECGAHITGLLKDKEDRRRNVRNEVQETVVSASCTWWRKSKTLQGLCRIIYNKQTKAQSQGELMCFPYCIRSERGLFKQDNRRKLLKDNG